MSKLVFIVWLYVFKQICVSSSYNFFLLWAWFLWYCFFRRCPCYRQGEKDSEKLSKWLEFLAKQMTKPEPSDFQWISPHCLFYCINVSRHIILCRVYYTVSRDVLKALPDILISITWLHNMDFPTSSHSLAKQEWIWFLNILKKDLEESTILQ